METQNHVIESAIKSMLPDKMANGLSREDAAVLYIAKHKPQETNAGLITMDRKLNPIPVEDHIKTFIESFGPIVTAKTGLEGLTKRSEVEDYFEKNKTPLSEQAGILAKAMKNEGFNINK